MDKDEKIKKYWILEPLKYSFLDKMVLSQDSEEDDESTRSLLKLEIVLLGGSYDTRFLFLRFQGVRDLKMHFTKLYNQLHLTILSIKEYQWENIKYKVEDEDNQLSFYCTNFEAYLDPPSL